MVKPYYAIAAKSKSTLLTLGQVLQIGNRSPSSCAMVKPWGAGIVNDKIQVWVNINYSGYREAFRQAWIEAWEQNLNKKLSIGEKKLVIEPSYDIDHIFPREKARQHGYEWVRLFESPQAINRGYKDAINTSASAFPDPYIVDETIWNKWQMVSK